MDESVSTIEYEYLNLPLIVSNKNHSEIKAEHSGVNKRLVYSFSILGIASLFLALTSLSGNPSQVRQALQPSKTNVLGISNSIDSYPNDINIKDRKLYLELVTDKLTNTNDIQAQNKQTIKQDLQNILRKLNNNESLTANDRLLILSHYDL